MAIGTATAFTLTSSTARDTPDLCYGYNAFWTHCLTCISLDTPGFEVETLMNLRVASAGLKISAVPSFEAERFYGQSNLNAVLDGGRVLRTIIKECVRTQGALRR
jgi:hypothetical protein